MKSKLKGTARLLGAFVAGMVVATALGGWAVNMIIDLQLFSQIPLAKVKESNPQ